MKTIITSLFALCSLTLIACDNNRVATSTGDSSVSVSPSIAQNLGAINKVVIEDSTNKANELGDNLGTYFNELAPTTGTDTNPSLIKFASADPTGDFSGNVEIDDVISCDDGGTKTLAGTLVFSSNSLTREGTLTGSYTTVYNGCVELVTLTSSTGNCVVELEIDGTFTNNISIDFSGITDGGRDNTNSESFSITADSSNTIPMEFAIDGGSTQNASFDFDFFLATFSSTDSLDGIITYNTLSYDMADMRTFVSSNSEGDVCP